MAHPLGVALVAVPALGFLAYKLFFEKKGPGEKVVEEATAAFTHPGPRGERVFNKDAAQGILRALPGMGYSHPTPGDKHLVEIHPERAGSPPPPDLSAAAWLKAQNRRMSVLAPVYLPMPTGAARYLRLAPPGHEADLAPYGYAVLAYAQAHHRPAPGQPITGLPPIRPQRTTPVVTPVSQAYDELPPALHGQLTSLLKNPIKPAQGAELANEFARSGLQATADLIDTKTRNAASQAALGMPTTGPLPSSTKGWAANVRDVQRLLISVGLLPVGADDGKYGNKTRAAITAFQKTVFYPESGIGDSETVQALLAVAAKKGHEPEAPPAGWAVSASKVRAALMLMGMSPSTSLDSNVKVFKRMHGLPENTIVDNDTWAAMNKALEARGGQAVSGASLDVTTIQQYLVKLNLLPFFAVTGTWDLPTRSAIRSFQSSRKLPANGILDDRTAALLSQAALQTPNAAGAAFSPYPDVPRQNISVTPWMGPPWS
jgi:peptidoglycan hydrolase-like protein with peptidoglycan-binding domain